MRTHCEGFAPVWDSNSKVLVLGSFPSVKSRQEGFYYGNKQNRFWSTVSGFFGEETPSSVADKRAFLIRNKIALWDVVMSCDIEGSADVSIRNAAIADIPSLLNESNIEAIMCNGTTAYNLFTQNFSALTALAKKLPSTSPANPRFSKEIWFNAFREVFGN